MDSSKRPEYIGPQSSMQDEQASNAQKPSGEKEDVTENESNEPDYKQENTCEHFDNENKDYERFQEPFILCRPPKRIPQHKIDLLGSLMWGKSASDRQQPHVILQNPHEPSLSQDRSLSPEKLPLKDRIRLLESQQKYKTQQSLECEPLENLGSTDEQRAGVAQEEHIPEAEAIAKLSLTDVKEPDIVS